MMLREMMEAGRFLYYVENETIHLWTFDKKKKQNLGRVPISEESKQNLGSSRNSEKN